MSKNTPQIVSRIAHVSLQVPDLAVATEFYGNVFGLAPVESRATGLYLSTGKTSSFDVHLTEGDNRLDHFAFGVRGAQALDDARERLAAAGVAFEESAARDEPGLAEGIMFSLPSGHVMELVVVSDPRGFTCSAEVAPQHHQVTGPVPLEHITVLASDIRSTAEFLIEHLGWRITDSWQPGTGEPWRNTWMRVGELHHDLAFLPAESDAPELHHFCFAVPAVADLVRIADVLAARGVTLDTAIGRHVAGNNVFLYFKDPFGNRCEVNTDMARIDPAAPPRVSRDSFQFDAWRQARPAALVAGSPVRDARSALAPS